MTEPVVIGNATLYNADCIEAMRSMPDESVHTCVTSPPYYGLRDYGHEGQIGLESTPAEYVARLVSVFREVWRVLRGDGTVWVNLGDTYASGGRKNRDPGQSKLHPAFTGDHDGATNWRPPDPDGVKPKDLLGIPWRVAFALQDDNWYLRQDIVWHKPNPMPESVRDRCTKAHEYLFLLSKSPRYHFDNEAIAEPSTGRERWFGDCGYSAGSGRNDGSSTESKPPRIRSGNKDRKKATERGCPNEGVAGSVPWEGTIRNKRSVWTVSTRPYSGAHFAVFPPALIEPCVLAGAPIGGTVLDPFAGSGTTGEVAVLNDRKAVLCEISEAYCQLAIERIENAQRQGRLAI